MFFKFEIHYYDEMEDKNTSTVGFVNAETMSEAVKNLTDFYGEENTIKVAVDYVTDDLLIEIPKDVDIEKLVAYNKI